MTDTDTIVKEIPGSEYDWMSKNYSDTGKLFIYLALSFGLTFLWFFLTIPKGKTWDSMGIAMQSFVSLGMLFPFISHIIMRWITKEGFAMTGKDSLMLGIDLKQGKWKYYILALLLPLIYTELGNVFTLLFDRSVYDPSYYESLGIDKKTLLLFPLNAVVTGLIGSFAALGEEGGWRGYMMPKLLKIFKAHGRIPALIIGGIIWGLWHAPLTCIGHNFGTEYFGFPYFGIVKMCVCCTLMGILLTFVTAKTHSIWPAAFLHAVNNASPSVLNGYINPDKANTNMWMSGTLLSLFLTVLIVLTIWKREDKMLGKTI
ncbi:MAG: CPBP family intramembrane metalloprotease [Lachnospiraceae bacterium]|nr:CPBP family intramembrane metalloprotease [Lachnospiraceae bacterium]